MKILYEELFVNQMSNKIGGDSNAIKRGVYKYFEKDSKGVHGAPKQIDFMGIILWNKMIFTKKYKTLYIKAGVQLAWVNIKTDQIIYFKLSKWMR